MKTLYTAAFVLFISISFSAKKITLQDNKLVATFKGITENDFYKFVDSKKVAHLFYDINVDIEIDLYDEDFIGKKFTLTWKTKEVDVLGADGEETGEKTTVKMIVTLEE
jgi:spore coat protein CotH